MGLPILFGLFQDGETVAGSIDHALRFTAARSHVAFVWPATYEAGSTGDASAPPVGQRFRLQASVDISCSSQTALIIFQGFKSNGIMLAANGGNWLLARSADAQRGNDDRHERGQVIRGSAFEAVDHSSLNVSNQSGQASASCFRYSNSTRRESCLSIYESHDAG